MGPSGSDPLLAVRERILRTLLLALTILGGIAYVPSLWLSLRSGALGLVIGAGDTITYAFVILLWRRPKIPYAVRAGALVAAFYVLALLLLALVGGFGAGLLWLLAACVSTAILFGFRTAVLSLGLTALTLVAIGIWVLVAPPPWARVPPLPVLQWFVLAANFVFLDAALTLSVAVVFRDLALSLGQVRVIRDELEAKTHALGQANAELQLQRTHRAATEARLRDLEHERVVGSLASAMGDHAARQRSSDHEDRLSVLVVDDEPLVARAHAMVLERAAFDVVTTTQAAHALERLAERRFDVLLTDLTMPGLDGFALAAHARALQPGLTVIVATGELESGLRDRAAAVHVHRLLQKPFSGHELVQACESAIRQDRV